MATSCNERDHTLSHVTISLSNQEIKVIYSIEDQFQSFLYIKINFTVDQFSCKVDILTPLSPASMGTWSAFMAPQQNSHEIGIKSWWLFPNYVSDGWLLDTMVGDSTIKSSSPPGLDIFRVFVTPSIYTLFVKGYPSQFHNSVTSSKWFWVQKVLILVTKNSHVDTICKTMSQQNHPHHFHPHFLCS